PVQFERCRSAPLKGHTRPQASCARADCPRICALQRTGYKGTGTRKSQKHGLTQGQNLFPMPVPCFLCCYFVPVLAPAPAFSYFRRKRSTRPAVSTSFCLPVKNGWQFEQISRWISPLWVDRVVNEFPQARITRISLYAGWMLAFTSVSFSYHRGTRSLSASFPGTSSLRELRRIQQAGVNTEVTKDTKGTLQ